MKMENNYNDFDTLKLYVKRTKVEEIIEHYKTFKWELVNMVDNEKYEDIIDLIFVRPHKIENKDELQLLQVYMEERLNDIGKLERNKHSKTVSLGLCSGVIGSAFLVLGVLFCLNVIPVLKLYGGIPFTVIGVALCILTSIFIPKIFKKENKQFSIKHSKLNTEVVEICNKVNELTGGLDGTQKN